MSKTFSHLVIAGTSGVGKTYLEEELAKTGLFYPLPKVVDRPLRPGDNPQKIISISARDFSQRKKQGEFFFTLTYLGHHYGWLKTDLTFNHQPKTLAITLESLASFLEQNSDFLPVLLEIKPNHFKLLEKRMKKRGEPPEKIVERLALAQKEYLKMTFYRKIVQHFQGLIFEITSDRNIPEEIIPQILATFHFNSTS